MARQKDLRDTVEDLRLEFVEHKTAFKGYAERQEECSRSLQADVKELGGQIAEQNKHLCEYNQSLAIHIEGVKEAKQQTAMLKDVYDKHVIESDSRLQNLEKPFILIGAAAGALKATATIFKRIGYIAVGASALYGAWRVIFDHLIGR